MHHRGDAGVEHARRRSRGGLARGRRCARSPAWTGAAASARGRPRARPRGRSRRRASGPASAAAGRAARRGCAGWPARRTRWRRRSAARCRRRAPRPPSGRPPCSCSASAESTTAAPSRATATTSAGDSRLHAVRLAAAVPQGHRRAGPPRADPRSPVGPLRHAAHRHGRDDAPRPRRLHHRLAQRPRRARSPRAPFGFDEYVDHVVRFLNVLGPGAHLLAVCQPCVQALIATAVMAESGNPCAPRSLTLMAGPIDTRINPTAVNDLATRRRIEWFEQNVISTVPLALPRRRAPGLPRLPAAHRVPVDERRRHIKSPSRLYQNLADGDARGRRPPASSTTSTSPCST